MQRMGPAARGSRQRRRGWVVGAGRLEVTPRGLIPVRRGPCLACATPPPQAWLDEATTDVVGNFEELSDAVERFQRAEKLELTQGECYA